MAGSANGPYARSIRGTKIAARDAAFLARTRTRTNTSPYDTRAIAVGRSGCACGAQKVRVCWAGVDRDGPRAPLADREVRDEQTHREKRSSLLFFDHGKYGNCH
jgi:hypothetical protein